MVATKHHVDIRHREPVWQNRFKWVVIIRNNWPGTIRAHLLANVDQTLLKSACGIAHFPAWLEEGEAQWRSWIFQKIQGHLAEEGESREKPLWD